MKLPMTLRVCRYVKAPSDITLVNFNPKRCAAWRKGNVCIFDNTGKPCDARKAILDWAPEE